MSESIIQYSTSNSIDDITINHKQPTLVYTKIANINPDTLNHLSLVEKRYLKSISSSKRKQEYAFARHIIKAVLSHITNYPIQSIVIQKNTRGRPYILRPKSDINISWSHHNEHLLIGLSKGASIGVDIESSLRKLPYLKLADRFFHKKEYLELKQLPMSKIGETFLALWCQKEAVYKLSNISFMQVLNKHLDRLKTEGIHICQHKQGDLIFALACEKKPIAVKMFEVNSDI